MASPLLMAPLALPPDLVEVRAGDVDQDGRDELVLVSRKDRGNQPDSMSLTVVHFSALGVEEARQQIELGAVARYWDIQGGIWIIDGQGVARIDLDGTLHRVASLPTPLDGLGPTTPAPLDFAHDLDGDGSAELLVYSRGVFFAIDAQGERQGALVAPADGFLGSRDRAGATGWVTSQRMPALVVDDIDGDGRDDLLLPERDQAKLALSGATIGERLLDVKLPLDLEPEEKPALDQDTEERRVAGAWFQDLDGDGRTDLLVHRTVTKGSWFGSTAELFFASGDGKSFVKRQSIETDAAAVDVRTLDFDGDGDLDLLVPQVDVNMGNLASALVSKVVKIDLTLFVMEDGQYAEDPVRLARLKFPVDRSEVMHVQGRLDLTGDGIVDLVTDNGEDVVSVYPGRAYAFADEPSHSHAIRVPPGEDHLFTHDLNGDGRAEIVVWGRGQRQGALLRVP